MRRKDVIIVGTGVAGLFCALNLPRNLNILLISKKDLSESNSFLAQGGICVLPDSEDYDSYMEDTLKAGHYENCKESVDIMIRSSQKIIQDLIYYGVEFERQNQHLKFTREGAHSKPRILYHKDITGEEITTKLLQRVRERNNIELIPHLTMVDLICGKNTCYGIIGRTIDGSLIKIEASRTVLACGGIGGLYEHSTNYPHLTGDGLAVAIKNGIKLKDVDYVQIHPTTLYMKKPGRRFLISESLRGEGAFLYDAQMKRFVDELLPRDLLAHAIYKQMEIDNTPYVWLSLEALSKEKILERFPNIYQRCLEEGYDLTQECIPVVPAQHYYMGGIETDTRGATSMAQLFAIGETSCNGVHGANRLASNSLLESLVFAKRCAQEIKKTISTSIVNHGHTNRISLEPYEDYEGLKKTYRKLVKDEIERTRKHHERSNINGIKCG
ncbi:L-aspartate oxidase [Aequitasia blattaphilus]|uniref:L-aspartate oxidase n=1 Tax=Aequitasia blattaphilus TaxID=2949332 RepID=A0ABT1E500_9FIRM|nr:L-aspartate oxidase [Aequitasia blattaphilus]MCP1100921.1 L-aspartate oxidase [Aequitasia blattaphilus]MCR8613561.1 L-aspartate oxidase [Aequitasia blattaphilus]